MNFVQEFLKGKQGKNLGLPTGLPTLDRAIDGVQRKKIYGLAAGPKVGKTTFADFAFVLSPYLHLLENPNIRVNWIYYSYEVDRVQKEFKFAAFFFYLDYGISTFTHEGRVYELSARYLMGKLKDDNLELIMVKPEHEEILKQIYLTRIIPLFGEYDSQGKRIKKGAIEFIEDRDNPTGLWKHLLRYANDNGQFIFEEYETLDDNGHKIKKKRRSGYKPNDPELYTIIITDHLRKLLDERGWTKKKVVDKWIEYSVILRNLCKFTFVHIIHLNRSLSDVWRLKHHSEYLYPTGDDVKDTGNLSEEADYLLTMFNPNDEKYNLPKHFGLELKDAMGELLYPNYRSLHIVESRDTECPLHIQLNMYGNINYFQKINQ